MKNQTVPNGSLRVNLIRPDGSFDTLPVKSTLPDGADMSDTCLQEILSMLGIDRAAGNVIKEVDVEDFQKEGWKKIRIVMSFKEFVTPADHLALMEMVEHAKHIHKNNGLDDTCAICGHDIRHPIHRRMTK